MSFNEIAFYFSDKQVMWHGILVGIGILSAVIMALILRLIQGENAGEIFITSALSCLISPVLARLVYWYCCSGQFNSFYSAMTDLSGGGFSIVGVIAGIFISAYIVKLIGATDSFSKLLDCILPAGVLGIAVARLGGFFTSADKGKFIISDENLQKLPYAFPVENSAGEFEWRIPTFLYESISSFAVFVVMLFIFIIVYTKEKNNQLREFGIPALLTMSLFGFQQVCLESMRYDTLYTRFNGFVSLVQIFCAVLAVIPLVVFIIKRIKLKRFKVIHVILAVLVLGLIGFAGYLEYYVQRYADLYSQCYSIMMAVLMLAFIMIACFGVGLRRKVVTQ